jgi:hypothetical protein
MADLPTLSLALGFLREEASLVLVSVVSVWKIALLLDALLAVKHSKG